MSTPSKCRVIYQEILVLVEFATLDTCCGKVLEYTARLGGGVSNTLLSSSRSGTRPKTVLGYCPMEWRAFRNSVTNRCKVKVDPSEK